MEVSSNRARCAVVVALLGTIFTPGCRSTGAASNSTVAFTKVPPFAEGSPDQLNDIEGRATGVHAGEKIVLYARSGGWWVQPFGDHPFTAIGADSVWKGHTHPGFGYAALLVTSGYRPSPKIDALPGKGGGVLAIVTAEGSGSPNSAGPTLLFGGYEWMIRQTPARPGGTRNDYDPANAWTDANGHLHMRISGSSGHWTSAEVHLTRSLGYGSYRFRVRELAHLEPSVVFAMVTSDPNTISSEMNIEISRWGEFAGRNGQFVIQPYYIPANTVQFQVPAGISTFMLRWSAGRASYEAWSGENANTLLREHVFTSGVPSPATESVHLNLYVFGNTRNPLRQGTEVVVDSFEYLP
ncbi:MAG: hypothetical protein ABSH09_04375 [Bryobacteraceae bacterium]|jgi:hypothetical protein